MTGVPPWLLLDPDTPLGLCTGGLHEVTGADHAKPVRTPGGVVHVCVYCWQEHELLFMTAAGASARARQHRTARHAVERAALIVDEVAVERVTRGFTRYSTLTVREQHAMINRMRQQGIGSRIIQARTGMNDRVVQRKWATGYVPALHHWEEAMLNAMLTGQHTVRQLVAA